MNNKIKAEFIDDVPLSNDGIHNDKSLMAISDHGDEIVREIDVFVSPALAHQMHLVQFPLQHHPMPLPQDARIRPHHGVLELDQTLPTNIGREGGFYHPKRTFVSHTIPISTHMAIGKMQDDAIHLTPLYHISQMRPNFDHVDETMNPSELDEETPPEPSKDKKPLMFQKKESDRNNTARKSSYAYKKASEESEEWVVLLSHGPGSSEYENALAKVMEQSNISLASGDGYAFVQSLNYIPKSQEEKLDADALAPAAMEEEEETSTATQVIHKLVQVLSRGWPVPYSVIRSHFQYMEDHDLFISLGSCAVLVRGSFCLQSKLLSFDPEVSHARTFILYIFQMQGYVSESRLHRVFDGTFVTPGWIRMILQQVAIPTKRGWTFKLEDDHGFGDLHSEQSKLHNQYWERQATRFEDKLVKYKSSS